MNGKHAPSRLVGSVILTIAALSLALIGVARAQGTSGASADVHSYAIDSTASLAWWQVNPHMKHLWATTCPLDPSWLPGEGRSSGMGVDEHMFDFPPEDTTHIPLLQRVRVRPVCTEAVHGHLMTPDTATWIDTQGRIVVEAAALVSGEKQRDEFARKSVLETDKYPQIVFNIEGIMDAKRTGDTTTALAVGELMLHGKSTPIAVHVLSWHENGTLRVRGRWYMTPNELWSKYGISKQAMALGVGMGIWKQLWMGVDLVLRPEPVRSARY